MLPTRCIGVAAAVLILLLLRRLHSPASSLPLLDADLGCAPVHLQNETSEAEEAPTTRVTFQSPHVDLEANDTPRVWARSTKAMLAAVDATWARFRARSSEDEFRRTPFEIELDEDVQAMKHYVGHHHWVPDPDVATEEMQKVAIPTQATSLHDNASTRSAPPPPPRHHSLKTRLLSSHTPRSVTSR